MTLRSRSDLEPVTVCAQTGARPSPELLKPVLTKGVSQDPGCPYPMLFPLIGEAATTNPLAQLIKRLRDRADGTFEPGRWVDMITHDELPLNAFHVAGPARPVVAPQGRDDRIPQGTGHWAPIRTGPACSCEARHRAE